MATVTAFIQHTPIGKSTQAQPYTAAANARYNMRKSEMDFFYSEHMPRNYHAVQRWINEREDGLRINGRVQDGMIISVPHDVSEEHAIAILKGLGRSLGKGRAPFYFVGHGFKGNNHHAHFVFFDSDIETGKRVFGTSERGSTQRIKLEWESVANQAFEEMGYDVRVKVHEGYELQAENDNQEALETPSVEASDVDDLSDIETSPEDALTGDEDMALIEQERTENVSLVAHEIRLLHMNAGELNRLRDAKQRLRDAEERYERAVAMEERAKTAASGHYADKLTPAQQKAHQTTIALSNHTTSRGKLKGFGLNMFGFELKTQARKAAEEAQYRHADAQRDAEYLARDQKDYDHSAHVAHVETLESIVETSNRRAQLRATYGTDREIEDAERTFDATILKVINQVPPEYALEAFERLEITEDEYVEYLKQSGNEKALAEFMENRDKYVIMEVDDDYEV